MSRAPARWQRFAAISLHLFAAVQLSCGGAPPHDLAVTSYSPNAPLLAAEDLEINFDQDVVDGKRIGEPIDPDLIRVEPEFEFSARWTGTSRLAITPKSPLRGSTRYKISLAGKLAERTGGFSFEMTHKPLRLEGLGGRDLSAIGRDEPLPLTFNQPVRSQAVIDACSLHTDTSPVALTASHPDAVATVVPVKPATPLPAGASVKLVCKGLIGDGGNVAMDDNTLAMTVRPLL